MAEQPPPPFPRRPGAPESCTKTTPGPRSLSGPRPTGCSTSILLSAARERDPPGPGKGGRRRRPTRRARRTRRSLTDGRARGPAVPPLSLAPSRAAPLATSETLRPRRPDGAKPRPRPAPLRLKLTPPRDAAAPALRPFPPHLRSAAAPHLLARSARPVGARTDPPGPSGPRRLGMRRPPPPSPSRHKPRRRTEGSGQSPAGAKENLAASAASTTKSLHSSAPPGENVTRGRSVRRLTSARNHRARAGRLERPLRRGASRDRSGRPRESQRAPSGGSRPVLLPLQSAGRAGTGFPGFFPALPPSAQAAPFEKCLSQRVGKPVNTSHGRCLKKRTALPFPCAAQDSPFLKPCRRKLVASKSLSHSRRESAPFSPTFSQLG